MFYFWFLIFLIYLYLYFYYYHFLFCLCICLDLCKWIVYNKESEQKVIQLFHIFGKFYIHKHYVQEPNLHSVTFFINLNMIALSCSRLIIYDA